MRKQAESIADYDIDPQSFDLLPSPAPKVSVTWFYSKSRAFLLRDS
jgi:hypothetical protein